MPSIDTAPLRAIALGPRGNLVERRGDGSVILRSPEPLGPCARCITERLVHWATVTPDARFLAQRDAAGAWRVVSYREAYVKVLGLAQGLLDRGLSKDRPLAILSGNGIEHALLALAAMHVGIPYAPVSVAFSLLSKDHAKLRHVIGLVEPAMVFVDSSATYERALDAVAHDSIEVLAVDTVGSSRHATLFDELAATLATDAVTRAAAAVDGDTLAKILFSSGSSALPKGVLNTQRMLCSNQQMAAQVWPFLSEAPPVLLDWLPWNHTFGGNLVFGLNLFHGGCLSIDDGRALPGEIEKTIRNLRDVAPTVYFGVPKAYEMLLPYLEAEPALARIFFSRMQMLFYAAAAFPQPVWDRLRRIGIETTGERIFTCTTLGSTETAPLAITANWDADRSNILGLPVPGSEVKLVPNGRKAELRYRGPHVTPGYLKQPETTAQAFDEDGWYRSGDALRFADEADVSSGLMFDGRIAEDYKLSTGTWVNAGPLRAMANSHLVPLVRDVLPTGHSRDEVGLLVFPEIEVCRRLAGLDAAATVADILRSTAIRDEFARRLRAIAAQGTSSVNTVTRMMLMAEPLVDVEVTDKGSLSFAVVLERRAGDIEALYGPVVHEHAIVLAREDSARAA